MPGILLESDGSVRCPVSDRSGGSKEGHKQGFLGQLSRLEKPEDIVGNMVESAEIKRKRDANEHVEGIEMAKLVHQGNVKDGVTLGCQ